jgi:NAD-dependent deacetylase
MKKIVVLSGAGISAESGLKTFRDSDGLWENYRIEEVATPMAWRKNPQLVLDFYNQRRKQTLNAKPNEAHIALAKLQEKFEVVILTQNIDDLHERAGSKNVIHLHGEILKSRSSLNQDLIYSCLDEIKLGDCCELGTQLRPHIVWFGEAVPLMEDAIREVMSADIFIVVGTSLVVYPVAGLVQYVKEDAQKFVVNPETQSLKGFKVIQSRASEGVPVIVEQLIK